MLGAGAVLRIPELLETAVALLVLVVAQLVRVRWRGRDLTATRSIHPPAGMAGSPVTVEVTVSSRRGLPAGEALVWLEPAPQALGGARRLELIPEGPHRAAARYRLTAGRRGRYVLEAGRLTSTDPFGLAQAPRPAGSPSVLVVFPRLESLRGRVPVGAGSTGASTASAASLTAGSEFFATREWQPGDDMRRIHWRSTARMGKVMVKQEALRGHDRATVVLDNHAASYAGGWEGPNGSDAFERAVEAAASIVHHFLAEGFAVRLAMAASDRDLAHARGAAHHRLLMTALATVGLAPATVAPGVLPALGERDREGLVVLVGGVPEAKRSEQLSLLLRGHDALVVLTTAGAGMPAEPASHRVLHLPRGQTLAAAWIGAREVPRRGPT
ncbi:MAG TPA: DUF58 domain-containing protein [Actinomycetota bacterium]|jgi:uncharacterized protein (DUF58 family)